MALVLDRMLVSMFGMVEETYQISRKAKFPRKKYMGVCRRESHLTAQTMAPLANLAKDSEKQQELP